MQEKILSYFYTLKTPQEILKKHIHIQENNQDVKIVINIDFLKPEDLTTLENIEKTLSYNLKELGKKIFIIKTSDKKDPSSTKTIPRVKHVIAIASGKGGVGKSTTAVNLAYALQQDNNHVGLMDADIFGPSLPTMLGISKKPDVLENEKKILPIKHHNIEVMSIGFMVPENSPVIWRGLMVQKAIQQFLNDVAWGYDTPLDYLIIDLPPGTGDVQLTILQNITLSGALIVSTPQDLALADAKRAYQMFLKTNTPVLGMIDNMNHLNCPHCEQKIDVFGEKAVQNYAEKENIPILGKIPLSLAIRKATDQNNPVVLEDPQSIEAQYYFHIAHQLKDSLHAI